MGNLLEWWNFMFLVPLLSGLLIGLAVVVTGIGAGEADADLEVDADLEPSFSATTAEAEMVDADTDTPALGKILGFFGLGQGVPLSVMLPILLVMAGLMGLLLNSALSSLWPNPWFFAPVSLVASGLLAGIAAQGIARGLGRLLSPKSTAIRRVDLVGQTGRAIYPITAQKGTAHVRDSSGMIHRLNCRSHRGQIPAGTDVLIVEYDSEKRVFLVEAYALSRKEA